jgi:SPP1 gp7 family putative phage head morphogenesis protein
MIDNDGKLREWEDFKEAAQKIGDKYNANWMRTEYDQCIAGAQNAARWVEFEQNEDAMPNLQYQTAGDNNVRESHRVLNGITRPMKDDFWKTHYPPNGWGCRCEALQVPNGLAPVTPKESIPPSPVPKMFSTNLAKAGLIFPKGHPYYNGISNAELRKAIAYLPPENTYINVVAGNSEIDIHPLHEQNELHKNLEAVNALLQVEPKAKIKLLPVINEKDKEKKHLFYPENYLEKYPNKNADILLNGKAAEIEVPNGSKSSIQNAIKHGKEQSDFVLIQLPDEINIEDAKRFTNGQMNHYHDKEDLTVWLYNSNEKIEYKTQKRQ